MLKLISINIEGSNHFDSVIPFLNSQNPDVVCMQEVIVDDMDFLKKELGMEGVFAPEAFGAIYGEKRLAGSALFSKIPLQNISKKYYQGSEDKIQNIDREKLHFTSDEFHELKGLSILSADVKLDSLIYRIATTHFMWTQDGVATPKQVKKLDNLFHVLDTMGDFVLAGDFNAPRGRETFDIIAKRYKDNIPLEYKTSLDQVIHKPFKNIPEDMSRFMVDGLFTTPKYQAHNVRLQDGVSDHMAIVADIKYCDNI